MKKRLLLAALALAALASGCGRFRDYGAVIEGNRLTRSGRYQDATAAYLSVRPAGFGAVLSYDLANVYARLGEAEAAQTLYAEVRAAGDAGLTEAAYYNEGVLLYEKGRYAEAYKAFRAALALQPRDEEARRNLELAWRDWQKRRAAESERATPTERADKGSDDEEIRLLRRLETGRFRSGAPAPAALSPDDY
jgi:tetratricopeptide (TPR) repeat protein